MEKIFIPDNEHVVRVILYLDNNGTISPKSFKLRQWPEPKGPERYISVIRYEAESAEKDLRAFDKGRNLPCAMMNVGDIRAIEFFLGATKQYPVVFDVRDMHTEANRSHAGIFITVNGMPLEGSGETLFNTLEIGVEKEMSVMAVRRLLVDIASMSLTTIGSLWNDHLTLP